MLTVTELNIYPIKSLGGFSVLSAFVTDRGFAYDRRWMLIDAENRFLSQREFPKMASLQVALAKDGLLVSNKHNPQQNITILFGTESNSTEQVTIWNDTCEAQPLGAEINEWFSDMLSYHCRLVYMPDASKRPVDPAYSSGNEIASFADAYPFLIIGQSSLNDLNSRLSSPVPMNRFRPNIVFTGSAPYQEDLMEEFVINGVHFFGVKLCGRCVITTIDQSTSIASKEPLRTLAKYRTKDKNVYFGQNLLHRGEGSISVGDEIIIKRIKEATSFNLTA